MADSSSSDRDSSDRENDSILSTMSPITARTSLASPDALSIDTSDDLRKNRRNSNVRFMETRLSSGEEGQASSLPTSSEAQTHQSGREEKGTSTSQPYLELLEERSRLEDRVSILENRLHTLELPRLSDFSEKGDGSSERSGLSVEPQWMTWQEYLEPTNKATNILEVLIEKPHTNTRRRSYVIKPANDAQSGIPEVKNIERIRFRSIHIVNALQQITEQTFPSLSCFTIHRPFKILLFYRDAIEEYVSELEENFRQYTFCALGDQCRACIHREDPIVRSPTKYQSMPEAQRAEYRSRRRASSGEHVWGPGQVFEANNGSHRPLEVQRHVFDTAGVENVYPSAGLDDSECRHEDSDDLLAQSEALTHLRALLKFMREDMREIFGRHDLLRSSHAGQISFINIWHLFMAGDLVVTNDVSNRMIYRVSILPAHQFFSSRRPVKEMKLKSDGSHQQVESVYTQESMSVMNIDVFHYNFDGRNFGPVETRIAVVSYDGLKNITDLPVYPLRFHADADSFRNTMLERGRKFREMLTVPHWEYNGLSASEPQEQARFPAIDSQVIVDIPLAYRKHPNIAPKFGLKSWIEDDARIVTEACGVPGCTDCFKGRFMFDDHRIDRQRTVEFMDTNQELLRTIDDVSELTDELMLLLPNRVYGFVLRSRRWYFLDIDTIHAVHRQSEGFESLILPQGIARLVEGLVQTHGLRNEQAVASEESISEHQFDLVRGKGKGLIILLHGAPGVGKTSTAECVADYTRRPLFPITCGDIGETAKEVEQNLERNFSLAHRWGCVLLLDEADVFLQARDKEDMRRNSVVSVFLRVLEYYSGILFLTTNKVGHFDEAFKSRIHVSLYYPQLDKETAHKIWEMNLKRLIGNGERIEVDGKAIMKYAKKHYKGLSKAKRGPWNGRQIKNAFQTAIALAEFDAATDGHARPVLTVDHFQIVAKASEGFDEYLSKIHGPDNDRARRDGGRDDGQSQPVVFPMPRKSTQKHDTSESSSSAEDSEDEHKRPKKDKSLKKKARFKSSRQKGKARESSSDEISSSSSEASKAKEKRRLRKEKSAKKKAKESEAESDGTSTE